jgi:Tol biopolymer transport system component
VPIDQAIVIARQIVDALESAHRRNIIHRDLKPANIKLTPEGKEKVLDFGLAKALADENARADLSNSPTLMSGSIAGVIMGTAAYMSPEQARGADVDSRTDIWAFGCVLYELLSAKPVFSGATATDIIAKVIERPPDWSLLPAETPLLIRTLLASTLTKDQMERLQQIGDARVFLKPAEIPMPSVAPTRERRGRLAILALTAALVAALIPATLYFLRAPEEKTELRFEIPAPGLLQRVIPSISPDGQRVAYTAQNDGKSAIWIRSIGELKARPLAGTENGAAPFWAPDSRRIAFFADGKLKKIDLEGGPATTLANSTVPAVGSWSRDGVILFSAVQGSSPIIFRVSESGGAATVVTTPQGGAFDVVPQFLPDGRHFLFSELNLQRPSDAQLDAGSIDGGPPLRIMSIGDIRRVDNIPGRYAAPGYLLFVREGILMAQRFDPKRLALAGEPVAIAEHSGPFSVSDQQTIVFQATNGQVQQSGNTRLLWVDRNGKPGLSVGALGFFQTLRLSPDGKRVAVDQWKDGDTDIWVIDLDRGVPNKLTLDPAVDRNPLWSPDGKRIVFSSGRAGALDRIFLRSSVSIGADDPLSTETPGTAGDVADDWSRDGKYIVFLRYAPNSLNLDIWVKPMTGDGKPFPYVQSKSFAQGEPRVSPNGRWLAYTTNESGSDQIVVQTFPDPLGNKKQVTANGGVYPTWRTDGGELYYLAPDGKMMAVPVKPGNDFDPGQPGALFQTPLTFPANPLAHQYDVSPDGKRFLFIAPVSSNNSKAAAANESGTITAIVNWTAALRKK